MVMLLASVLLSMQAEGFSATVTAPTSSAIDVYEGLASTPLVRASDASSVILPSLWRSNTPLGIADEKAVCAFLRHYG